MGEIIRFRPKSRPEPIMEDYDMSLEIMAFLDEVRASLSPKLYKRFLTAAVDPRIYDQCSYEVQALVEDYWSIIFGD